MEQGVKRGGGGEVISWCMGCMDVDFALATAIAFHTIIIKTEYDYCVVNHLQFDSSKFIVQLYFHVSHTLLVCVAMLVYMLVCVAMLVYMLVREFAW